MARRPTLTPLMATLALALALTACGGGGGSNDTSTPGTGTPPGSTVTTISGTAAAGAPVIGQVTVRDSLGAQKTVTIAANGSYTVDVSGMTAPFQFRAVGKVGGRDVALSSVATSADVGGTINITPFTDLIVANIAGRAVDGYLSTAEFANLTTAELNAARDTLTQRLLPVLQAFGVADSFDLLRTSFAADRTAFDAVMDVVKVSIDPDTNQAVIRDLINNQQITDNLASKTDTTTIATPPAGSLTGAVTDLQKVNTLLTTMTGLFATGLPAENNATLLSLIHADFLDNGLTLDEFLTPDNLPEVGSTLHNPVILQRLENGDLRVGFEYVSPEWGAESVEWYFRKDEAGNWRALGNRRLVDLSLDPINSRFFFNGQWSYSRHLELWIDSAHTSVQSAVLTGPGLVGNVVFTRSTTTPEANFSLGGNGSSWIPECVGVAQSTCVNFASVSNDTDYTVTLRDADNNTVGEPITVTLQRPPVSSTEAQANAAKWFATYTINPTSYTALADGVNISYTWTPPTEAGYKVSTLGFSSGSVWLSVDPIGSATTQVVGTWEGPAPTFTPNTWIHVEGPYNRHFVSSQSLGQ